MTRGQEKRSIASRRGQSLRMEVGPERPVWWYNAAVGNRLSLGRTIGKKIKEGGKEGTGRAREI